MFIISIIFRNEVFNLKKYFNTIFVVLVYKNYHDLIDFINSVKNIKSSKVLIVNSYYDQASEKRIKEIALSFDCDFLNISNKGYGYGNNKGIEYAKTKYEFDFLIISNPDIIVKKFDTKLISDECIMGPVILSNKNTNQNPYRIHFNKHLERMTYNSYKKNRNLILLFIAIYYKFKREISILKLSLFKKNSLEVFALHGAFIIFPHKILRQINYKPFYNKMFLFNEELYLASLCKDKKIKSKFINDIKVVHKEDGSISLSNVKVNEESKKSYIIYYEKCILENNITS